MKKEVKKIFKLEESLDEKMSEIEWIISLPLENDIKADIIRKILTGIKIDITKTHYDSLIDKQTGLLNKNSLNKMFKAKRQEAIEKKAFISVIIADLNYLKNYNDILGHSAGDVVIKQYSDIVKKSLRKADIAFRYGGDEFVIICVHKKASDVRIIVDRVRKNNDSSNISAEYPVSASIGFATAKSDQETVFRDLFEKADKMLYREKKNKSMPKFLENMIDEKLNLL